MRSWSLKDVRTSTSTPMSRAWICRIAVTPSTFGIWRSISTTSGRSRLDHLERLLAVLGVPDHQDVVGAASSSDSSPARIMAWSSTMTTRIGGASPASGSVVT